MIYQLYDCVSDYEILVRSIKEDAERELKRLGGNANGYYIFEIEEKNE